MRFEFKLRIGSIAIEASDYDYFVPFQITLWRYDGSSGHSVCNLRWGHFNWHGWRDRSGIWLTCEPRVINGHRDANGHFVPEPEDVWDDLIV